MHKKKKTYLPCHILLLCKVQTAEAFSAGFLNDQFSLGWAGLKQGWGASVAGQVHREGAWVGGGSSGTSVCGDVKRLQGGSGGKRWAKACR